MSKAAFCICKNKDEDQLTPWSIFIFLLHITLCTPAEKPIIIPPVYEVYRGYIVFAFSVCVCVCLNFFFLNIFLSNYLTKGFEIWYKHQV